MIDPAHASHNPGPMRSSEGGFVEPIFLLVSSALAPTTAAN
jgi:hypothetical protein